MTDNLRRTDHPGEAFVKKLEAGFSTERARLQALLEGPWGIDDRNFALLADCPVCAACVEPASKDRHAAWHLRCLQ